MQKTIFESTQYWVLKNSRNQYLCTNGKVKQNGRFAILFDSKKEAIEGRRTKKSFKVYEVIMRQQLTSDYPNSRLETIDVKEIRHTDEG
jgi:DNA topoisomerase IA